MNETLNKNLTLIQEVATKALEEHKNSTAAHAVLDAFAADTNGVYLEGVND